MSERMTCVFDYDVRKFDGNPHKAETPFGVPIIISRGDMLSENERLRAAAAPEERDELLRWLCAELEFEEPFISEALLDDDGFVDLAKFSEAAANAIRDLTRALADNQSVRLAKQATGEGE